MAKRVAVVNDDQVFLGFMEALLRDEEGHETLTLNETSAAHATLAAWRPDVIVLDLAMERRDSGWALLERIRRHPQTREVPVIVCSADVRTLLERAGDLRERDCAVLAKPFYIGELLDLLSTLTGPGAGQGPGR